MTSGSLGPAAERQCRNALHRSRRVIGTLAFGALLLAGVATWFAPPERPQRLAAPLTLLGFVSPVVGFRLYHRILENLPEGADRTLCCAAFERAGLLAAAITEAVALLGIVVFVVSGSRLPLVGVLTHLLLCGAIWPSPERLERFLDAAPPAGAR